MPAINQIILFISISIAEEQEQQLQLNWLKYSKEPWSKVVDYWKTTFPLRQLNGKSSGKVNDIVDTFPVLKQPLGYTLVRNLDYL